MIYSFLTINMFLSVHPARLRKNQANFCLYSSCTHLDRTKIKNVFDRTVHTLNKMAQQSSLSIFKQVIL